jgi:hypothetical protein
VRAATIDGAPGVYSEIAESEQCWCAGLGLWIKGMAVPRFRQLPLAGVQTLRIARPAEESAARACGGPPLLSEKACGTIGLMERQQKGAERYSTPSGGIDILHQDSWSIVPMCPDELA